MKIWQMTNHNVKIWLNKSNKKIKIWDVYVGNITISKLIKTETNSKYFDGYLDKLIRPIVLTLPKKRWYVKTFTRTRTINRFLSV